MGCGLRRFNDTYAPKLRRSCQFLSVIMQMTNCFEGEQLAGDSIRTKLEGIDFHKTPCDKEEANCISVAAIQTRDNISHSPKNKSNEKVARSAKKNKCGCEPYSHDRRKMNPCKKVPVKIWKLTSEHLLVSLRIEVGGSSWRKEVWRPAQCVRHSRVLLLLLCVKSQTL